MVKKVDELTEYIENKLVAANLRNRMNVIYVSDHGMQSVSSPNFINLTSFLEHGTYEMYGSSPIMQVVPQDGMIGWTTVKPSKNVCILCNVTGKYDVTLDKLKKAAAENGHFNAFSNDELPKRWHVQNAERMGPITVVADDKYAFQDMYDSAIYYEKTYNISSKPSRVNRQHIFVSFHVFFSFVVVSPTTKYGVHGYDNDNPSMRSIFFADGPKFRKQYLHQPFDNLDLFHLICLILDMKPTPINGTVENVRGLLIDSAQESNGHNLGINGFIFSYLLLNNLV